MIFLLEFGHFDRRTDHPPLVYGWRLEAIGRQLCDRADLDFDVLLAVAGAAFAVFPSSKLLDVDFVAFCLADDFGSNFGTIDRWRAQFEVTFAFGDSQNFVKCQLGTCFEGAEINLEKLAFFDFVLVTAVRDNRVHAWFTEVLNCK